MNIVPPNLAPAGPHKMVATEGEFAGWSTWSRDSFESNNGPFWHRIGDDGGIRCAFRVDKKHINGSGAVHGGCLMAFADYCLFAIGNKVLAGRGVTLSFTSEFIDAAKEGELIEGHGEVVRAGRSILFLRGMLTSAGRPLLTFSGTIKRINAPRKSD